MLKLHSKLVGLCRHTQTPCNHQVIFKNQLANFIRIFGCRHSAPEDHISHALKSNVIWACEQVHSISLIICLASSVVQSNSIYKFDMDIIEFENFWHATHRLKVEASLQAYLLPKSLFDFITLYNKSFGLN